MKLNMKTLISAADLAGTFVFALEGALAAILAGFDVLGVLVLSFITALGGGVIRDLMIGAVPPVAIRQWYYAAIALAAGTATFLCYPLVARVPPLALVAIDAAGLSLFAIAGTQKALEHGINPLGAVLLGTVTAVGGGIIRDVLLMRVPVVLHADFYATCALAGSGVMVVAPRLGVPARTAAIMGGLLCLMLRLASLWLHWQLPRIGVPGLVPGQ